MQKIETLDLVCIKGDFRVLKIILKTTAGLRNIVCFIKVGIIRRYDVGVITMRILLMQGEGYPILIAIILFFSVVNTNIPLTHPALFISLRPTVRKKGKVEDVIRREKAVHDTGQRI